MTLQEIFDRSGEVSWAQDIARDRAHVKSSGQIRDEQLKGLWWVFQGKKMAGPFADSEKANSFRTNRPDRVPEGSKLVSL